MNKMRQSPLYFYALIPSVLCMLPMLPTAWEFYPYFKPIFKYIGFFFSVLTLLEAFHYYTSTKRLVIISLFLLTLLVGFINGSYLRLFFIFTLIVGAVNIDYKMILKVWLILCASFCLFSVLGTLMGFIHETSVDIGDREVLFESITDRRDFGYGWATDFAYHVMFILLVYWIIKDGYLKIIELTGFVLITFVVYSLTDARMAVGGMCLIIISALYCNRIKSKRIKIGKIGNFFLTISIPFFAFISFYMVKAFDSMSPSWMVVDLLMSKRLSISSKTIEEAGIPLLGQKFEFYGMSQTQNESGIAGFYNYIDCSYVQSLVTNGIILTVLFILLFVFICRASYKRQDIVLAIAVVIAGVTGMVAQYLFVISYCPLLLALTSSHGTQSPKDSI